MNYRPDIDGLRAIAVMAVILNHISETHFPNGYLGVDIFFVISGFVITASLQKRNYGSFWDYIISFYSRRMVRLLPALLACLLISSIVISSIDPEPREYLRTGIAAAFGLSNLYLWWRSADYFSDATGLNPYTHTWSLGVEEQFYLVFPLVFWSAVIWHGSKNLLFLGVYAFILLILSFFSFLLIFDIDSSAAFYIFVFRAWQLLVGSIIYCALQPLSIDRTLGHTTSQLSFCGLTCILILALLNPIHIESKLNQIILTIVAGLLIVIGGQTSFMGRMRFDLISTNAMFLYLGKSSYSLYLWHWPIIVFAKWTFGLESLLNILAVCFIIFLISHLSFVFIEKPFRESQKRTPRRIVGTGMGITLVSALIILALERQFHPSLYLGNSPNMLSLGVKTLSQPYTADDGSTWMGEPCILQRNSDVGKRIDIQKCTLGDFDNAKRRIIVIGNSFSAAFVPSFATERVVNRDYAVTITSSWGASPVPNIRNDTIWNLANDYYWESVVPALVADLQENDIVFIISDLANYSPPAQNSATLRRSLISGLEQVSLDLKKEGIFLAVLGPLPFAREAECEPELAIPQWYAPAGGPCHFISKEQTIYRQKDLRSKLTELQLLSNIIYIDLFETFCPSETCNYFSGSGEILYRDAFSHPSVEAATLSSSQIFDQLDGLFHVHD
ncbi:MAG: acyltransferase family protein [Bacteroidota bacterium]